MTPQETSDALHSALHSFLDSLPAGTAACFQAYLGDQDDSEFAARLDRLIELLEQA